MCLNLFCNNPDSPVDNGNDLCEDCLSEMAVHYTATVPPNISEEEKDKAMEAIDAWLETYA